MPSMLSQTDEQFSEKTGTDLCPCSLIFQTLCPHAQRLEQNTESSRGCEADQKSVGVAPPVPPPRPFPHHHQAKGLKKNAPTLYVYHMYIYM